ncbi:MAG TPA: hypothetical protein VK638_01180, partial [Edaphobacter sp.]|nr:hypothetical protein [Edaphobacter sp.]
MIQRIFVLLIFSLVARSAVSQFYNFPGQGIVPGATYSVSDIDSIDPLAGTLVLHIPILSFPQAGDLPPLTFEVIYNNSIWNLSTTYNGTWSGDSQQWYLHSNGVHLVRTGYLWTTPNILYSDDTGTIDWVDTINDSTGGTHPLGYRDTLFGTTAETIDATGIKLEFPATGGSVITTPDGITYSQGCTQDGNGNCFPYDVEKDAAGHSITTNFDGTTFTSLTDSLGRTFPSGIFTPASGMPSTGPYGQAGCYNYQYPGPPPTGQVSIQVCVQSYTAQSQFDTTAIQFPQSFTSISSITLPNGKQWTFSYNSWGDLESITSPSGSTVTYSWYTTNGPGRAIQSKTVSHDGVQDIWTYQNTSTCTSTCTPSATVTDPLGNTTAYTYDIPTGRVTHAVYTDAHYQVVKTEDTEYYKPTGNPYPSGGVMISGNYNIVPKKTTTTLPNGQVSLTCTIYDNNSNMNCDGTDSPATGGATFYDFIHSIPYIPVTYNTFPLVYGVPVATLTYDYGAGQPGNLLRKQSTQYQWQTNSGYENANLLQLPATITTGYNSQSPVSQTLYSYDDTTYSGAPPYSGLPTSITDGLTGETATTYSFYDSSGNLFKTKDARGTETTLSRQCNGAYPATVTTAGLQTTYGYDCNTGLLTSVQDPNGPTTTYSYDSMRNLTSIAAPDSGGITVDYGNYNLPLTVTATKLAAPNVVFTQSLDQLGRVTSSSTTGSQTNSIYNALNQVTAVSTPFLPGASPIAYTSYSYDMLSQLRKQCQPDNNQSDPLVCPVSSSNDTSVQTYAITDNQTLFKDEVGNVWRRTYDGLQRLTTVEESPYSPAGGSTNATTRYTYDPVGNLLSVNQSGSGSTRSRGFSYDSHSRLTTASNPENGTVCYGLWNGSACLNGYDGNGNLVKKTDARGVVASYSYDALNRITSKAYSGETNPDGTPSTHPTLTSCYAYDSNFDSGLNTLGRLTGEWTQSGACTANPQNIPSSAMSWKKGISYDAVGRLKDEIQCPVAPCATANPMHYDYDLAGNISHQGNGLANSQSPQVSWTNSYDEQQIKLFERLGHARQKSTFLPAHRGSRPCSSAGLSMVGLKKEYPEE